MTKRLLLIGGSYFIGRVFSILAAREQEFELHVLNRGRFPLKNDKITEYFMDRHDVRSMKNKLPEQEYDAVIDFCAYDPGDIRGVLENLPGEVRQYIYISSCSVFRPSAAGMPLKEDAPKLGGRPEGPAGQYAYNKMLLEKELREACASKKIAGTVLRPAFVYGPFNYAPRESYYFKEVLSESEIAVPTDSAARFQFVYVKDIARALMSCAGNEKAYDEDYNLSAPEQVTYRTWMELLEEITGQKLKTRGVTVEDVYGMNLPLPFPLDQDELYDGGKLCLDLGFSYTPLKQGMAETFDIFRKSFG